MDREKFTQLGIMLKQHFMLVLESGTVFLFTLKSVNPLNFLKEKSQNIFLETGLANFVKLTSYVLNI